MADYRKSFEDRCRDINDVVKQIELRRCDLPPGIVCSRSRFKAVTVLPKAFEHTSLAEGFCCKPKNKDSAIEKVPHVSFVLFDPRRPKQSSNMKLYGIPAIHLHNMR